MKWSICVCDTNTCSSLWILRGSKAAMSPRSNRMARRSKSVSIHKTGSPDRPLMRLACSSGRMERRWLAFHETRQLARPRRMTQLLKRLGFDLPDALARHAEHLADLFQRMFGRAADAKAHSQDALFARRQLRQRFADGIAHGTRLRRCLRIDCIGRLDQITERRIAILADRQVERSRLLHERQHLLDMRK